MISLQEALTTGRLTEAIILTGTGGLNNILPLRSHDEKYNTQLLDTLELYVGNNCNKTQTEKALFIHKNTLRARLDAIGKLLDCNVDSVEDLLNLQIALKLRTLFE